MNPARQMKPGLTGHLVELVGSGALVDMPAPYPRLTPRRLPREELP